MAIITGKITHDHSEDFKQNSNPSEANSVLVSDLGTVSIDQGKSVGFFTSLPISLHSLEATKLDTVGIKKIPFQPEPNTLGFWDFRLPQGDVVLDKSGNGVDGIPQGGLAWETDADGGLQVGSPVVFGDGSLLNPANGNYSIDWFVSPRINGLFDGLNLYCGNYSASGGMEIRISYGYVGSYPYQHGTTYITGRIRLADGTDLVVQRAITTTSSLIGNLLLRLSWINGKLDLVVGSDSFIGKGTHSASTGKTPMSASRPLSMGKDAGAGVCTAMALRVSSNPPATDIAAESFAAYSNSNVFIQTRTAATSGSFNDDWIGGLNDLPGCYVSNFGDKHAISLNQYVEASYAKKVEAPIPELGNGWVDFVPPMRAATYNGVTISDTSLANGSYPGWRAFDDTLGDASRYYTWDDGILTIDLGEENARTVRGYTIRGYDHYDRRYDPRDWVFSASVDNESWTVLDTRSNMIFESKDEIKTFLLEDETPYRYYRLAITRGFGQTGTSIVTEFEILGWSGWHYDFGESTPRHIRKIVLGRQMIASEHAPFVVERSHDGESWHHVSTVWPAKARDQHTLLLDASEPSRYWRVRPKDAKADSFSVAPKFYEISSSTRTHDSSLAISTDKTDYKTGVGSLKVSGAADTSGQKIFIRIPHQSLLSYDFVSMIARCDNPEARFKAKMHKAASVNAPVSGVSNLAWEHDANLSEAWSEVFLPDLARLAAESPNPTDFNEPSFFWMEIEVIHSREGFNLWIDNLSFRKGLASGEQIRSPLKDWFQYRAILLTTA